MAYSNFDPTFNMLNSFLHPEKGYENAGKEVQQGWNQSQDYQKPFWQQGQDQYGSLNQARQDLMDPGKLQNQWAQGYETSPYAQRMLQMNQGQGLDAASSMGLMGSSGAMANIQQGAGDIMNRDREQYMKDLMEKYMKGIGLGHDLYNTGATAGTNLGSGAMTHGQDMGNMAFGQTNAPGHLYGSLLRTGAGMMMGGPVGAAMAGGGGNQYNQAGGY